MLLDITGVSRVVTQAKLEDIDNRLKKQLLFLQLCVPKNFDNIGLIGPREDSNGISYFFL